jgi:uncharacterized protein
MISRLFKYPKDHSFFLLGPRGTGKSLFLRHTFASCIYLDLLDDRVFQQLLAQPSRLEDMIPAGSKNWIVIDEIQKIPKLLDEVHRLIENRKFKFILTGSSARKLKRTGANLLAGRAFSQHSYPLTALELGDQFSVSKALHAGLLPKAYLEDHPKDYLASYVTTYLKEEIQQEGLVRNISSFARFLEAASFSQGQILNYSKVAKDSAVERKTVTNYFQILEDLLLSHTLEVFSRRAKRELITQRKFYFFDLGVFQQIRPRGPLDSDSEITGASVETLVLQELLARNEYQDLGYTVHFWHTRDHVEVDFILYGPRGLKAIEIKSGDHLRDRDFTGLLEFKKDYPQADLYLVYGGKENKKIKDIQVIPVEEFLRKTLDWI